MKAFIFDLEATGLDVMTSDVCSIGYIIYDTEENKSSSSLQYFAIDHEVPYSASKVNGLTQAKLEALSNGTTFLDYSDELLDIMRGCDILVGHNSNSFDIPLLRANFARAGRRMVKDEAKFVNKLSTLTDLSNIGWDTFDTIVAGKAFMHLNTKYGPKLGVLYNEVCSKLYHTTKENMDKIFASTRGKSGSVHEADYDVWMTFVIFRAFLPSLSKRN